MKDCAECKRRIEGKKTRPTTRYEMLEFARTCKGYPDFSLGNICFCPHQIKYILEHYELLKEGKQIRAESGYTDAPISGKGRKSDATRIQDSIMEVERRLEHCGYDGLITVLYYADKKDERFLGHYCWITEDVVRLRIESVIYHISGYNFNKSFRYDRWRAIRDYKLWQGRGE